MAYYVKDGYVAYYHDYGNNVPLLDDRIRAVCIPSRNAYPLNTQMSGQIYDSNTGIITSDGNGVQATIENGSTYIGESRGGTEQDGRLVLNESFTTVTHSFIGVGYDYLGDTSSDRNTLYIASNTWTINREEVTIRSAEFRSKGGDIIANSSVVIGLASDLTEYTGVIYYQGLTDGTFTISNINMDSLPEQKIFTCEFKMLFVYEGELTEQELRDELAKIKSGNYRIPSGITKVLDLS